MPQKPRVGQNASNALRSYNRIIGSVTTQCEKFKELGKLFFSSSNILQVNVCENFNATVCTPSQRNCFFLQSITVLKQIQQSMIVSLIFVSKVLTHMP